MGEPVRVALTQLVLWYDATRIQTWPSFLADVPPGMSFKAPTDFGRRFATKRALPPTAAENPQRPRRRSRRSNARRRTTGSHKGCDT